MELEAEVRRASEWKTIPNLLSFGRLVCTPILGWLIVK
jgi:hypothetical protein